MKEDFVWTDLAVSEIIRSGLSIAEFKKLWHQCKYCKSFTFQPDNECYARPPQPLFTTADGKKIYEGDEYWIVYASNFQLDKVCCADSNMYCLSDGGEIYKFSTKEAAEEYILINKPSPKIEGWAIDMNNCDIEDYEEFSRLWMKIKPIPLYKRKNKQS